MRIATHSKRTADLGMRRSNKIPENNSGSLFRVRLVALGIIFLASGIALRLAVLQLVRYDAFAQQAANQHKMVQQIAAQRGEIFLADDSGKPYPLAVNRELYLAYVAPREVKDPEAAIKAASAILSLDENEVRAKVTKDPDDMYEVLKRRVSEEEARRIREQGILGLHLLPDVVRFYPGGELAAHVAGFIGSDGQTEKGMYGLEAAREEILRGKDGKVEQERDARGRWISISDRTVQDAQHGADLVLTINQTMQFEVERILRETIEKHSADSGTIVVMEPGSGKILALANRPTFNPNEFSKVEDISVFANPAVSSPYECGSVFKPLTVAMGIDSGKINPDSTYVDKGVVSEAGYDIRNSDYKSYGTQTMTQVLEKSLNTGMIHIQRLVGNRTFAEYVERFGFGTRTGIELPGEVAGNIRNLADAKRDINFFTASFGQGISVTPLQLAAAYGALANKGMLVSPHIIDKVIYGNGKEEEMVPSQARQVVSEETAQKVAGMMRSVVVNGHGKRADVPGYLVGGKTGTAQVAKSGAKGYEEGVTIGSFAGFAPLNDPKFVVVVKIVNPKDVQWAESTAAPAFGKVMKFLLEYAKIKPTEDPSSSPLAKIAPLEPPKLEEVEGVDGASVKPSGTEEKKKDKKKE